MKACGFEILVSQAKTTAKDDTPVDLTYDKRWHHYKSSLAEKGYFKVTINIILLTLFNSSKLNSTIIVKLIK